MLLRLNFIGIQHIFRRVQLHAVDCCHLSVVNNIMPAVQNDRACVIVQDLAGWCYLCCNVAIVGDITIGMEYNIALTRHILPVQPPLAFTQSMNRSGDFAFGGNLAYIDNAVILIPNMPDGSIGLHNHGASRSNPALAGFEIFLFEGLVKQILRVNVKDTYSGPQYNIASGGLQLAVIDDKALCRHFYAIFAVD